MRLGDSAMGVLRVLCVSMLLLHEMCCCFRLPVVEVVVPDCKKDDVRPSILLVAGVVVKVEFEGDVHDLVLPLLLLP